MKTKGMNIKIKTIFASVLLVLQGCSVGSKVPAVSVEEVQLTQSQWDRILKRDGIELEDLSAIPVELQFSKSDFSAADDRRFFQVTNKLILDSLKSKLGTNFLKLQERYDQLKAIKGSPSQIPELGLSYRFRPVLDGLSSEEFVSFKLYEALDGLSALIEVRGKVVSQTWAGYPALTPSMNPFEGKERVVLYQQGEQSHLGYFNLPGGKLFGLSMKEDRYQLKDLRISLPLHEEVQETTSVRIDTHLASVLGSNGLVNSILFLYPNSSGHLKKIYVLDKGLVFRDYTSRCEVLMSSGFMPAGMICK